MDPDGTSHELSCSWHCEVQGGGSCNSTVDNDLIFAAVSGCVTEVQSNHFFAGKSYIIRFVPQNSDKRLFIIKPGTSKEKIKMSLSKMR